MMFRVILLCSLQPLFASLASLAFVGPQFRPTKGFVWPKPFLQVNHPGSLIVDPAKITFKFTDDKCDIIKKAAKRFNDNVKILGDLVKKYGNNSNEEVLEEGGGLEIQIMYNGPCKNIPDTEMDESYILNVTSKVTILSKTEVWGTLRALETLSQLHYVTTDFKHVRLNYAYIEDKPKFPYRGYLLDTSRHYSSVKNILKTLDAMEMNKLNVFHWHIYDDNSFPYVSSHFPELSQKGAYHSSMVYSKAVIQEIVEYANDRGIRVVLEFDMPGHTASIGMSHPEVISKCKGGSYSNPMNPVKKETYELLKRLLPEAQALIPNKYFHLGGDEVYDDCWNHDADVQKFMIQHNITDVNDIRKLFYKKTLPLLQDGTIPIFWEEVFNYGVRLPKNSIIQVWLSAGRLVDVIKKGYRGIQSADYYLDNLKRGFKDFYVDPRVEAKKKLKNEALLQNILGGTACMWGEWIDDTNALSRSWPRASAMAETLWSDTDGVKSHDIYNRIEEHTCRMRRRGVPAEPPAGPGFCVI